MAGIDQYAPWLGRPAAEVQRDLESFAALLLKWNAVQNLVSRETEKTVWDRHIVDSLQLLPLIDHRGASELNVMDIGSGGGLPAIPLAISLKGTGALFTLVEPISKKVSFLRTAIRELGLPAKVLAGRVEELDSRETPVDLITSRALAELKVLFGLIHPFFGPQTVAILHKGKDHAVELAESRLAWDFDVVLTNSVTDERGVLLRITNLRPKSGV
jgi:16S rRNA (guanine527-N7)-methyltransferase